MTSSHPPDATLADAGEFGAIAAFTALFAQSSAVVVGPGDDAAVVRVPGDVLVSTDVLVEGRHFRRDWATAEDVGRRAAAQSLSDLNAMGGTTTAVTVGLVAPADLPLSWAQGLAAGLAEECDLVGSSVVGGDLTRGDVLVVSVTAIGHAGGAPVLRSGARPGDVVALVGRQGWAAAGLAVLSRGFRSPRAVVEAYRRPEVPYDAGPEALLAGATAMVDVSDGLLADLGHVARASGVVVDLTSAALPVAEPLQAVGAATGTDPLTFVLAGGDDHPLTATFPSASAVPDGWTVIGSVSEPGPDAEAGTVTVDGSAYDGEQGWRHF
ncbi:thiamine-phosphate kinase [Nocardioides marmoribigeumensis]|uniref:Thiamine-monophosphate kinase n=1 Tax=Nocardioides marmoribigeumensis TaxID=433649 RepID=A0ABU2BS88_9ACTN|nr:thiamine-phosphate kinase [Nocardioides marmoribigeumensis]MDR7361486.1 thiamine-monophosphate kinase [Nocardioides marmoribigeumensis]